jgi:AICAR transformylase/IMP cyclohydrolase PurH
MSFVKIRKLIFAYNVFRHLKYNEIILTKDYAIYGNVAK